MREEAGEQISYITSPARQDRWSVCRGPRAVRRRGREDGGTDQLHHLTGQAGQVQRLPRTPRGETAREETQRGRFVIVVRLDTHRYVIRGRSNPSVRCSLSAGDVTINVHQANPATREQYSTGLVVFYVLAAHSTNRLQAISSLFVSLVFTVSTASHRHTGQTSSHAGVLTVCGTSGWQQRPSCRLSCWSRRSTSSAESSSSSSSWASSPAPSEDGTTRKCK